jgi:iron complex transport system ATP-binding protein
VTGTEAVLGCAQLAARYGRRAVLEDLTLAFTRGTFTAVVGPNGCGKSTLLRVLAGLLAPAAGAVRLDGRALAQWSGRERARRLAWLPQTAPASDLTARETVALGRFAHSGWLNRHDSEDDAAIEQALAATGAHTLAERRVTTLSGGERQRVNLARILAVGAQVLLLDEPTTHLDPPHQLEVLAILCAEAHARQAAVVAVVHDLSLALMADRLVVLGERGLIGEGSVQEVLAGEWLSIAFGTPITVLQVDGMHLWQPRSSSGLHD